MNIRLDSFLSKNGVCARRKAKDLITEGMVYVNGKRVSEVVKIDTDKDEVVVNGKKVGSENTKFRYIIFNKPVNVLSTTKDEHGRKTVLDFIKVKERVYPVGRLDYNSTGLILLTNDGQLALKLTHPKYEIPKKYVVRTEQNIKQEQLKKLETGIEIYYVITFPAEVKQLSLNSFEITLKQGLKRQIREMCKAVGLDVESLERVQLGSLKIKNLKQGEYRDLTTDELKKLSS